METVETVTNLLDINTRRVTSLMDTIYKVLDIVMAKSDGLAISAVKDMDTVERNIKCTTDIIESKIRSYVEKNILQ